MSLHISEDELRRKATVRYQEFSAETLGGFQIALNQSLSTSDSSSTFSYELENARLLLRQSEAEFQGVRHEYALDSLIRILLTMALLPKRGFLLHAASIVRDGRAYIFMGRSGAGKSTVSSLSPKGSVLTDEISLIRFDRDGWRAHGTPFWGEFRAAGQNQDYSIAGIYCLKQAKENRLVPLTVKEMLRAILPCVLFFSSDPQANNELLNILVGFTREIPCFRLHFLKDSSFWNAVQS